MTQSLRPRRISSNRKRHIECAGGSFRIPSGAPIGENPPAGASIWYYLKEKPKGDVTIEILEATGKSVKKFSSRETPGGRNRVAGGGDDEDGSGAPGPELASPAEKGLNRFVWDLRYPDAATLPRNDPLGGQHLWAAGRSRLISGQTDG